MASDDPIVQLKALAGLRDSGVLDEEEFAAKKRELLSLVGRSSGSRAEPFGQRPLSETPESELEGKITSGDIGLWHQRLAAERRTLWNVEARLWQCKRIRLLGRLVRRYASSVLLVRQKVKDVWVWGAIAISTTASAALGIIVSASLGYGPMGNVVSGAVVGLTGLVASCHVLFFPCNADLDAAITSWRKKSDSAEADQGKLMAERAQSKHRLNAISQTYARLCRIIQSQRHKLLSTDWRQLRGIPFEEFLADVFRQLGYLVETTKTSGDQGVDLILSKEGRRIAVQAKGYEGNVSNSAVQEAHTGMGFYNCHASAVITNSSFTASAKELAQRIECRLIEGSDIPDLIRGRVRL